MLFPTDTRLCPLVPINYKKERIAMNDISEKLQEIIIDEEFMRLMPPLNDNEFCSLE